MTQDSFQSRRDAENMIRRSEVVITYLRQVERPRFAPQPRPPGKTAILRVDEPPLHFYRYLYDIVGRRWNWVSRRKLSDTELLAIICRPETHIYVLYVNGAPAGLSEIDASVEPDIEIRFFGLVPEFIGRGLSRYFLSNVIDIAWSLGPREVRIETCTLDHPAALPLYQKFGFAVFDQRTVTIDLDEPNAARPQ
jgi:GNAT superfamily N-acetyltransferase